MRGSGGILLREAGAFSGGLGGARVEDERTGIIPSRYQRQHTKRQDGQNGPGYLSEHGGHGRRSLWRGVVFYEIEGQDGDAEG